MKTFTVQAAQTITHQTHVKVPDHWTKEDVQSYFLKYGVKGDFTELNSEWEWGAVIETPNIPESEIDSTLNTI